MTTLKKSKTVSNYPPDVCNGCQEKENCGVHRDRAYLCPCTLCLIKVMCDAPCRDYERVYDSIDLWMGDD